MGFLGGVFKSVAKGLGSIAKGIVKFAQSPFGKLLINVGLSFLTGGAGGLLAKGLSMLGGAGKIGSLLSTFSGVASKFLGPVQSFLSKTGLSTIAGFLGKTTNPSDLLSMATDLFKTRQSQPATDPTTDQIVQQNLMQLFAHQQAQQLSA
jgi:hypothetical protein